MSSYTLNLRSRVMQKTIKVASANGQLILWAITGFEDVLLKLRLGRYDFDQNTESIFGHFERAGIRFKFRSYST